MAHPPISDGLVKRLTQHQRDLLVEHIDGEVEIARASHLVPVRNSLMRTGMLKPAQTGTTRPKGTLLTERGRQVVGMILGEAADQLVRAGLLEQLDPVQALREIKARGTPVDNATALAPAIAALRALGK